MATYAEIQAQIEELTRQAEDVRKAEKAGVIAQIRELMANSGVTVDDIQGGGPRTRKSSGAVAAKYRDPVSGKTWSGRGRSPTWLSHAEANGASRNQFLV